MEIEIMNKFSFKVQQKKMVIKQYQTEVKLKRNTISCELYLNQIKNYVRAFLIRSFRAEILYHLVGAKIKLVEMLAFLLAHATSRVTSDAF